jgi:hypothetical protein
MSANYFYDLPIELVEKIQTKAVDLETRIRRNRLHCHTLWSCEELRDRILDFFLTAPRFKSTLKTEYWDNGYSFSRAVKIMPSKEFLYDLYDPCFYWKAFVVVEHALATFFMMMSKATKLITWNLITLNSCF